MLDVALSSRGSFSKRLFSISFVAVAGLAGAESCGLPDRTFVSDEEFYGSGGHGVAKVDGGGTGGSAGGDDGGSNTSGGGAGASNGGGGGTPSGGAAGSN